MKKYIFFLLSVLSGQAIYADASVSVAYAQGKVSGGDTLRGVNLKYQSHVTSGWGYVGSATYMSGKTSGLNYTHFPGFYPDIFGNVKRKSSYYSIMAGPSYRFSEHVSIYGLLGWVRTRVKGHGDWLNHEGDHYTKRGERDKSRSRNSIGYGVGVLIAPTMNMVFDVSYEGAGSTNLTNNKHMSAFSIGLGYRF